VVVRAFTQKNPTCGIPLLDKNLIEPAISRQNNSRLDSHCSLSEHDEMCTQQDTHQNWNGKPRSSARAQIVYTRYALKMLGRVAVNLCKHKLGTATDCKLKGQATQRACRSSYIHRTLQNKVLQIFYILAGACTADNVVSL
jgi:hypothetical protein